MIHALAWDDEPNGYMSDLAAYLAAPEIGIQLKIVATQDEFTRELYRGVWTFVINDLMRGAPSGQESAVGATLAESAIDRVGAVFKAFGR